MQLTVSRSAFSTSSQVISPSRILRAYSYTSTKAEVPSLASLAFSMGLPAWARSRVSLGKNEVPVGFPVRLSISVAVATSNEMVVVRPKRLVGTKASEALSRAVARRMLLKLTIMMDSNAFSQIMSSLQRVRRLVQNFFVAAGRSNSEKGDACSKRHSKR